MYLEINFLFITLEPSGGTVRVNNLQQPETAKSFFSYWETFHGHNYRGCASRFWCGMIGKVQFTAWISLSLADYMLWCSVVNTFQAHFSLGHTNDTQTFHSNSWCVSSKFRTIIEGKSGETCPGPDLKCYWEMTDGSHPLPWRHLRMDRLDLSRGP